MIARCGLQTHLPDACSRVVPELGAGPLTSGNRGLGRSPSVAAVALFDLLDGARTGRADRPNVFHKGRRAPRAAARGCSPAPYQPTSAPGLGEPSPVRRPRPEVAPSAALPSAG